MKKNIILFLCFSVLLTGISFGYNKVPKDIITYIEGEGAANLRELNLPLKLAPENIVKLWIIEYPAESQKIILLGKSEDGIYCNFGSVEFKGEVNIAKTDIFYEKEDGYVYIYSQMPFSAFSYVGKYKWSKSAQSLTLIKSYTEDPSAESLKKVEDCLSKGNISKALENLRYMLYPGHYYDDKEMAVKFLKSSHKEAVKQYRDGSNDSWKLMYDAITYFDYITEKGRWIFQFNSKKDYEKSDFIKYLSFDKFIEAVNDYGFLMDEGGKSKDAVSVLKYIVKMAPERIPAYLNLADALYKTGNREDAKKYYKSYVELMKKDGRDKEIPKSVYDRL